MKPRSSLQLLLKAKYLPPDRAAEMLRPVISMLRHVEPHGIEAHEASIALSVLIESLRSETGVLETLYDRFRTALLFSRVDDWRILSPGSATTVEQNCLLQFLKRAVVLNSAMDRPN